MADLVRVTGDFGIADDSPAEGRVWFGPWLDAVHADPDPVLVTRARVEERLDESGAFSVDLIGSHDPAWQTDGPVPYLVRWAVSGSYAERVFVIPEGPGPFDLFTLVDLKDPPTIVPTPIPGPPGADSTIPGPEGPQGPPGGTYTSAVWNFNQNTAVSPANGTIRMNAAAYPDVTLLWVAELDREGVDRTTGLGTVTPGMRILMQSAQGRAVWEVVGQADSGTYRTFTVTPVESSGTRPAASANTTLYFLPDPDTATGIPPGGTPGQLLVKTGAPDYAVGWGPVIRVSATAPTSPNIGDVWVDIS